jgi:NAD:arginine ADP-ribosyltransferase
MTILRMAPLAVDPAALSAAGAAVVAIGDDLVAALGALTAGFSANTGQDAAGEVFGLAYQDAAEALLKAAAAAINALRFNGAKIQLCASNYSKAEAASTVGGGGGGALPAPGDPVKIAAPGPPGTLGPGVAAPVLWVVVEAFVGGLWPNGDVAALRAAAGRWRAFGAALAGGQDALNKPKSAVDGQQIPEGALIQPVLSTLASHLGDLGGQCGKLATALDKFADDVAHAQNAIRDLLHRLGTVSGLWHEAESFFDGDALEEIKKIASDINALLHQLGRDAEAKSKVIKEGMQIIDGWVRDMEKDMRGEFTHFLGQTVGSAVATVFDTYVNIEEGIFKGGVGLVQTVDQLDPTRFVYDPQGAASTWGGLGETVVKANPLYALIDPGDALKNDLGLVKGLVHAEDWRSDRPGLGLGENLFDVATLFVPGAGEAGAGAEGAAAGTRAAAEDAAGTVGRAGRVAGEVGEAAGAGGALADIGNAGDGLTKDFENLGGELPKSDPPISGGPVGLSDPKPLDVPVEPTARVDSAMSSKAPIDPPAAAPASPAMPGGKGPFDPPTAPPGWEPPEPPGTPVGPRDPVPGPGGGPVSAPAVGPHDPVSTPLSGRPSALPTPYGGGTHELGHGAPADKPLPPGRPPHDAGNGNSPGSRPPGEQPPRDNTPHGPHDGGGDHPSGLPSLTWDDRLAFTHYTGLGYEDLNEALRSDTLDASQHARVAALNTALEKLPAHHGPVVRGTDLPPDVLAQYQPGEVVTEKAFLSSTTDPVVAQSPAFAGNVEFRIMSSTGRDISSFSLFPDEQEVLFRPRTRFYVVNKTVDPLTGRTIIEMIELGD